MRLLTLFSLYFIWTVYRPCSVSSFTNIYNGVAYMWIDLTVCMEIARICNKHEQLE